MDPRGRRDGQFFFSFCPFVSVGMQPGGYCCLNFFLFGVLTGESSGSMVVGIVVDGF